jgi:hypothetical protein
MIDDCGITDSPIHFKSTCLLQNGYEHKSLQRLGVPQLSKCNRQQIRRFLQQSAGSEPVDVFQASAYLRILLEGLKHAWWNTGEAGLPWPAKTGHSIALRNPAQSYVSNISVTSSLDTLPILITSVDGKYHDELRDLAKQWSAQDLSYVLTYPDLALRSEQRATDIEAKFFDVYGRLSDLFENQPQPIGWLRSIEVFKTNVRMPRFVAGNRQGIVSLPAVLPIGPNRIALLLTEGDAAISSHAFDKIAEWCVGEGFPSQMKASLAKAILLSYNDKEPGSSLDEFAETIKPGYWETRSQLGSWYIGCQICGWRTPTDEYGGTAEKIKSIYAGRLGFFQAKLEKYEAANCLYLCPRHALLAERGLVNFPFIHEPIVIHESREKIGRLIEEIPDQDYAQFPLTIRVYEWNVKQNAVHGWQDEALQFKPSHLKAVLLNMLEHLAKNE